MRPIKQLIHTIAGWLRAGWHLVTVTVHRGLQGLHRVYVLVVGRHARRWAGDSGYRRTILAALAALAATVMPHPALAAALGAALADRPRRYDPFDDEDDDLEEPRFDPRARRLWDTYA